MLTYWRFSRNQTHLCKYNIQQVYVVNIYNSYSVHFPFVSVFGEVNPICILYIFFLNGSFSPYRAPRLFFSSVIIFYTVGRTPRTSDKPVARPLPIHRTIKTQNKRIHKHSFLEWDSNPRSERPSKRRQFMR
jgi:hypothetical protein